jgi:hypothetical protein
VTSTPVPRNTAAVPVPPVTPRREPSSRTKKAPARLITEI